MSSTIKLYEHNQKTYDARPKRRKNMRWIPLAVFGRMNEGIRKGAFLF